MEELETFEEIFERHLARLEMREGQLVNATVIAIDNKYVTLNAGLKSETTIATAEFKDADGNVNLVVGDVVQVVIESIEDGHGETRLSREKALRIIAWQELEYALEHGTVLTGKVYGRVKGGLGVSYKEIRLFLPGSLIDLRPVRDLSLYDDIELEFKVIKVDKRRNNIVISRKAVIADKVDASSRIAIDTIQDGTIVSGIVKNITDYGVFVDLGGIDGLIYISDLSWTRVVHPSDVLALGDDISAIVLRVDHEKRRISLGLKQMTDDPWKSVHERFIVGSFLQGRISNLTDYGAFVELIPGVEGLVHTSEMDWTTKNIVPSKVFNVGLAVEVKVLAVDKNARRISLGIKQCKPNPWVEFAKFHKKGDIITGQIRSITDFGLFMSLDGNIDGLIHTSDVALSANGDVNAIKQYKKGEEISAMIISVDIERERVALSLQLPAADKQQHTTGTNQPDSVSAEGYLL